MTRVFFLLLIFFSGWIGCIAYADTPEQTVLTKKFGELIDNKPQCEIDLNRDTFIAELDRYADMINKGEYAPKQPLISNNYLIFQSFMRRWVKYKYVECDINISKAWLIRIGKMFSSMHKYSSAMDSAETNGKSVEFEKNKKLFNDTIELFLKEVKNPEKPDPKLREQKHIQKVKEHKLYQEYLRKTQKGEFIEN